MDEFKSSVKERLQLILLMSSIILISIFVYNPVLAQTELIDQNDKRQQLLNELKHLLPISETWDKWLEESGELPPDFDSLESIPFLPDPLQMQNGDKVVTSGQWPARQKEIKELLKHYLIGQYPDAPGNVRVREQKVHENTEMNTHEILLEFGPGYEATLSLELIIPQGEDLKPYPVFITQDNHRRWALVAVSRGYVGVVYAGADSKDDTEAWASIFPEYDWTRLTRRGWAAGRVIDYLETLDIIDHNKIAIVGHSRNGKASIIGGAIDDRVDAVISSSSGASGVLSFRSFSEIEFGESIEVISRNYPSWVHPRLRFFVGREDKLPIDAPDLVNVIAPRPFLFSHALYDQYESSVWDLENSYRSSKKVYDLLNANNKIELLYRFGTHETRAEDIEQYVDWLDYQFGRNNFSPSNSPIYPTFKNWRKNATKIPDPYQYPERDLNDLMYLNNGSVITTVEDWENKLKNIRKRIRDGLGKQPPAGISFPGRYGAEPAYAAEMLDRSVLPDDVSKISLNFGNYINGDLYYPKFATEDNKIPVVIWLHPVSPAKGYVEAYRRGNPVYLELVNAGFAVMAYDMAGHGSRLNEAIRFHERYPDWTLLGKMVNDVMQAVNALLLKPLTEYDGFGEINFIDNEQIYVLGYSMGGKVALHAAALDVRIAGAISLAGFTPMRLDDKNKLTGGLARWSKHYPLQPWLAEFIESESRVPYDYHEVIASIAPRKVAIITPELDRQSTLEDVIHTVSEAKNVFKLFNAGNNLRFKIACDYNNFGPEMQSIIIKELRLLIDQESEDF